MQLHQFQNLMGQDSEQRLRRNGLHPKVSTLQTNTVLHANIKLWENTRQGIRMLG